MGCHLVVQSSRFGYGPPSRALFDLGMVLGAVFFKGTETGSSFGIIFLVFVWSEENRKNKHVSKIGPEYPKRCSSIGGPRETGFRAENCKKNRLNLNFRCLGFSEFGISCIFSHCAVLSDVVGHEF